MAAVNGSRCPLHLTGMGVQILGPQDASTLQSFYETNPEYFVLIEGTPPPPTAAEEDLSSRPPADMPWRERWFLGFLTENIPSSGPAPFVAVAEVVRDLMAQGVWHIGLLIVATEQWGSGLGGRIVEGLENWALQAGADWMRLGVVQANVRGLRFWQRQGYHIVRQRENMAFGSRTHTVLVMAKGLRGHALADYLGRIPRDRS